MNLRSYLKEIENYIEQNQNDQAIAHCLNIIQKYPYLVDALRFLGQAYLESKMFTEAINYFERVVSIVPDDFVSHVAFSSIKEEERDLDGAIFHMEIAFDSQPSNTIVQEELKRLIGKRDGSTPEKISLSRGALVRMYGKGELYQQAINEINAALLLNPQRTDLKILLAEMLLKSNAAVQAAEICNQIVDILPFCLVPNQILYQIYLENGLIENSKPVLDRLIAINPYYSWIVPLSSSVEDVPDEKIEIEKIEYASAFSTSSFANWDRPNTAASTPGLNTDEKANNQLSGISSEFMDELLIPGGPFTMEHSVADSVNSIANPSLIKDFPENPLPDFLQQAGWQPSITPEVGPPTDYYENPQKEAQKSDLPEWLKIKASEEFIVNSSISNALNELAHDTNDLSNVNVSVPEEGNHSTRSNDNQPANSEVTMSDDNSPVNASKDESSDWMAQFFDEAKSNQKEADSEKELPDWLTNLDQEETDTNPEESLPDWLNTLDSDIVEKKDDAQITSELDAILSDLANQSQDDTLTPIETAEDVESEVPTLDAEDISSRLADFTQIKPSFLPTDDPKHNTPDESVEELDIHGEDEVNYSIPSAETEEDDNQIPDWVKTVLSGPEIPDLPSTETESLIAETEHVVPESPNFSMETEIEVSDDSSDEGAISASTSEELLTWLKEISPEQLPSDDSDVKSEKLRNEHETSEAESMENAQDSLIVSTPEADLVELSADLASVQQDEELSSEASPRDDTEDISSNSLADQSLGDQNSDSIPQQEVPASLDPENLSTVENEMQEVAPEIIDNSPDEVLQLVALINNNQFEDAIHHELFSTLSENDQVKILDELEELKPERESDFEFMQFFGDVLAKFNRFNEALEAYNRAEEVLTQDQE